MTGSSGHWVIGSLVSNDEDSLCQFCIKLVKNCICAKILFGLWSKGFVSDLTPLCSVLIWQFVGIVIMLISLWRYTWTFKISLYSSPWFNLLFQGIGSLGHSLLLLLLHLKLHTCSSTWAASSCSEAQRERRFQEKGRWDWRRWWRSCLLLLH